MREGIFPDVENDFRVGRGPANRHPRRTIEEVCIGGRVGNVRRTSHRYRTASRETQGGAQVAGYRTAVDAERRVGDHDLAGSAVVTHLDQIVHETATGNGRVLPGDPLRQAPVRPSGDEDGKQENGVSPAHCRTRDARKSDEAATGRNRYRSWNPTTQGRSRTPKVAAPASATRGIRFDRSRATSRRRARTERARVP